MQRETGSVLTLQESTALQSLAMLPLQMVATKVTLTLPFESLATLLRSIRHRLSAATETPVIHFVSPHKDEGADVIAFELAYIASTQPGKRVLFINTGLNSGLVSRQVQGGGAAANANPVLENGDAVPQDTNSFFFTTISDPAARHTLLPDARDFRKVLEDLRRMFDLVVIHSDSALSSQMAFTLYGLTDGGIIVAEAESTRIPVIKQLRNVIESHGGHVIGVVLNKRKYYIPRRLYSLLFRS
jgi:Mrp family chromosome partitioning ATPase